MQELIHRILKGRQIAVRLGGLQDLNEHIKIRINDVRLHVDGLHGNILAAVLQTVHFLDDAVHRRELIKIARLENIDDDAAQLDELLRKIYRHLRSLFFHYSVTPLYFKSSRADCTLSTPSAFLMGANSRSRTASKGRQLFMSRTQSTTSVSYL